MKTLITTLLGALALGGSAFAGDHTAAFERLKSLVGTWSGKMEMEGEEAREMTMVYRMVAGDSVLEERSFPGTPMEMVTMYHQQGDKLVLTHYCMLGNQPKLQLAKTGESTLHFDFDPGCGIDVAEEMHMHSLIVTFVDEDTVKHDWTMFADGKALAKNPVTLQRVKSK